LSSNAELPFPWALAAGIGAAIAATVALVVGAGWLLKHWGKLPSVFSTTDIRLVHYNLVHTPVTVRPSD
jgi:hypothetical protein